MHAFNIAIGAHFLGARRRITPLVAIVAAVANLTRELLIGFGKGSQRGRQFSIGGSMGVIGLDQFLQYPFLSSSIRSEGVKIFVEVSSQTSWTILLIWFWRLPKCIISGAKLVLVSNVLLLDFCLLVCCLLQIFPDQPNFLVLGKFLISFLRLGKMLRRKHGFCCNEEEGVLHDGVP